MPKFNGLVLASFATRAFGAAALLATPLLWSTTANAAPMLEIGLQQAGVNGGAITTVATSTNGFVSFASDYGTFTFNSITATGSPILSEPNLLTNSVQVSSTNAGTIKVFITEKGLSSPQGVNPFLSSFTSNLFNGAATSVVEQTFLSASNADYTGLLMGSNTFTAIGTATSVNTSPTISGLFSETVQYTVTVGAGTSNVNDTINISPVAAVPEPVSLTLLGSGLLGLAMFRRAKA